MGLSAPKQKQRLVGSASTRNTAWLNDAEAPGQRMMAQMGWSTGQSLGSSMTGLTENLKVAYKMDNKGIGAQRHEREARASGKDVWVGGGGDLGSLFERLNAANAVPLQPEASASAEQSERKRQKKGKSRDKDEETEQPSKKKRKKGEAKDNTQERQSKREAKAERKAKKSRTKEISSAITTLAQAEPALASDRAALEEIQQDAVQGRPVRLAHRAKFLRAKRMVSASDLASVNEILGIASSPSPSVPATPKLASAVLTPDASSKTYPGPGGAEIQLMDVDKRLVEETELQPRSEAKTKKEKKSKRSKESKEGTKSKNKRSKKIKTDKTEPPPPLATATPPPPITPADDGDEGANEKQIGTNTQGLHVFEYLNRRLMLRKAQIARQHQAQQQAVFTRAATIRA